ncbi:serine hydrolase domain-containing protein [Novosphingobium colocasiae]
MPVRRLSLIAALAMLPALTGCGGSQPDAPPPPSREAEAAIASDGGAPHDALGRAIDALFDADAVGETRALLIMKRGSVIAERYGPGFDAGSRLQGWSMSQCLTALTIGQLVSDGRLRLNETASIPAWQRPGDPRGAIILRQLLQMRSGLRHREDAVPARTSDRFRMLFLDGRDDMAAYAEAQPLAAPAGQAFAISSATGVILADLAARALTDSRDPRVRAALVSEYMRTRILEPVGMTSTVIGFDRAGTMIGSSMMEATARDWARVGELLRHTGSVKGGADPAAPLDTVHAGTLAPQSRLWCRSLAQSSGRKGIAQPAMARRRARKPVRLPGRTRTGGARIAGPASHRGPPGCHRAGQGGRAAR